ncbi:hypothetical protein SCUP234_02895 [Seiridium cupressi]
MVLLTSSQVSVAISSVIVVLFTTALFLSGYVIQQRTLRDLRKAIRPDPRPSPRIYLPDRFKKSTTELEDGTVIDIDEQEAPSGDAMQQKKGDFVIEIRPSVPEEVVQKPLAAEKKEEGKGSKETAAESAKEDARQQGNEEQPMSRAERRRRIKEEIMELSQGETPVYYQRRLW